MNDENTKDENVKQDPILDLSIEKVDKMDIHFVDGSSLVLCLL